MTLLGHRYPIYGICRIVTPSALPVILPLEFAASPFCLAWIDNSNLLNRSGK